VVYYFPRAYRMWVHSTNMRFTVSVELRKTRVSLTNHRQTIKCERVSRERPVRRRVISIESRQEVFLYVYRPNTSTVQQNGTGRRMSHVALLLLCHLTNLTTRSKCSARTRIYRCHESVLLDSIPAKHPVIFCDKKNNTHCLAD